jgi:hypothetical protein
MCVVVVVVVGASQMTVSQRSEMGRAHGLGPRGEVVSVITIKTGQRF